MVTFNSNKVDSCFLSLQQRQYPHGYFQSKSRQEELKHKQIKWLPCQNKYISCCTGNTQTWALIRQEKKSQLKSEWTAE